MARYTDPVCRLCRREGCKLFLKGERCYTGKCAVEKRVEKSDKPEKAGAARHVAVPGQHGQGHQRKPSEYGLQLREKQKARRAYGLLEGQFYRTYERAANMKGVTGENLLILLERRLDNVVYRCGFAASRPQARQLVLHGHFTVNGKKVNIPSYEVDANDVVAVKVGSKDIEIFKAAREGSSRLIPKWITVNADELTANITTLPTREDIDLNLQENMIVEYYSR